MRPVDTPRPKLILISGPPASGKSALAERLGRELCLPVFSSDSFKEVLFDHFDSTDPGTEFRETLGKIGFELLYHAMKACLTSGTTAIFEANFHPAKNNDRLKTLFAGFDAVPFYIYCFADRSVIDSRFRARATTETRHAGHKDQEKIQSDRYPDMLFESNFRLDIGTTPHEVDTTDFDTIDHGRLESGIRTFLSR